MGNANCFNSIQHKGLLRICPIFVQCFPNPFTLRDPLKYIVCHSHTFENNLRMMQHFTKYLKESCCIASYQHFSIKCFREKAFIRKILQKSLGLFSPLTNASLGEPRGLLNADHYLRIIFHDVGMPS